MTLEFQPATLPSLDRLQADTLVLFVSETDRPPTGITGLADWRLTGRISRWLARGFFSGRRGEKLLMPGLGRLSVQRVLGIGIGEVASLDASGLEALGRSVGAALVEAQVESAACGIPGDPFGPLPAAEAAQAFRAGLSATFQRRLVLLGDVRALREAFPDDASDLETR